MSNVIEYKCPNCGGSLVFDSGSQKVVCPHCQTEFDAEAIESFNEELSSTKPENFEWESSSNEYSEEETSHMGVYHCDSCGAEIVADDNTSATTCPFCESPVILKGRLSGALKPDVIIPFKYDKNSTKEAIDKYLKGKLFLPSVFKKENKVEKIKGLYEPFWLYDADVKGKVFYRAERSFSYMSGDYQVTETSHFRIIINGQASFDNIPVDASSTMPDDLMESIEPFDYEGLKDFTPVYLSGYLSDKYDVSKDECSHRANQRFVNGTVDKFREDITGYSAVRSESTSLELSNAKSRYALLPVWILNTKWKDKKFTFSMNAQTGKMVGNLPCSPLKYALWFAGLFIGTTALLSLILWLFAGGVEEGDYLICFLLSMLFGWIPSAIFCRHHRKALKPVALQNSAKNYYRDDSLSIAGRKDIFLYRTVTRVKVRDSSSNSSRRR